VFSQHRGHDGGVTARARRQENRILHNRLRVVRTEHGLSRAELAGRIGVNVQTVGALERGQYYPSLYVAMLIAETLHTAVEDVFSWQRWDPDLPPMRG
jgi:DNA-binding XRE family transcriptional regulator